MFKMGVCMTRTNPACVSRKPSGLRITAVSAFAACAAPEIESFPPQGPDATGLILLIHGSGDSANDWPSELATQLEDSMKNAALWDVVAYDWADDAENRLRAAAVGLRQGEALGDFLSSERNYEALQVIAHSVGGHVSHGISLTWQEGILQQTFLDPFGGRGLLRWGYGHRRFGETATFAETYFNADDGVPSTERAPRHTHGFDVTDTRDRLYEEDPHWWPIDWYRGSRDSGYGLDLALPFSGADHWDNFPIGENSIL